MLSLALPIAANASAASAVLQASVVDGLDARIADALKKSGANRVEIEKFLARYDAGTDAEKRGAARWLAARDAGVFVFFCGVSISPPDPRLARRLAWRRGRRL